MHGTKATAAAVVLDAFFAVPVPNLAAKAENIDLRWRKDQLPGFRLSELFVLDGQIQTVNILHGGNNISRP